MKHVIVVISAMGVSSKNIKFGDMEKGHDYLRTGSTFSGLNFIFLIFVTLV